MMRKLYWKIFLTFWATMIITIIVTGFISAEFFRNYNEEQRDMSFMRTIVSAATLMINRGGEKEFLYFADYINHHERVQLKLIPGDGKFYPTAWPDTQLQTALKSYEQRPFPQKTIRHRPFIISAPFMTADGHYYRIIAKLPPKSISFFKFRWQSFVFRSFIALLISGIICYLLSVYLSNPIQALRAVAKKLGEGDLNTRVGALFANRKDEIADLALEFDQMAEHLQELVQSREQLLRDISHELRSPLARLYVALEMAQDKTQGIAEVELNRIALEAQRLNDLIGGLLSLARIDSLQSVPTREKFSLRDFIQDLVDDANFENKGPTRVQFWAQESFEINSNKMLLTRVIENCLRNALQYTPLEKPIEVKLFSRDKKIFIEIQDFGPGVSPEKLSHIFDPFYRVDNARSPQKGGYGLGLAIAKKSIKVLKGDISAENTPQAGLKIIIELPLENKNGVVA